MMSGAVGRTIVAAVTIVVVAVKALAHHLARESRLP
jgi:hypothetical protein